MSKRVLLTGAAGFVGAHLLRAILQQTNWSVACPVTFRHRGLPERIDWALSDVGPRASQVDIIRCDLAAPVNRTTAARFGKPDLIFHLAADTHPPRSIDEPVEFMHNNIDSTLYLLEFARTVGRLESFVLLSTDSVYGPAAGFHDSHQEWEPIVPNNPYAASKASAEAAAIAWWRSFDVPVMIATTMNPMGETQDVEKFIPMTIGKILRDEKVIIHQNAAGEYGGRTYLDVAQLVDALLWLVNNAPASRYSQHAAACPSRWNVAGLQFMNNLAVAHTIASALGREMNWAAEAVDRPEHGHRYSLDPAKLSIAGWSAQGDISDAIARTARWFADNPIWLEPER